MRQNALIQCGITIIRHCKRDIIRPLIRPSIGKRLTFFKIFFIMFRVRSMLSFDNTNATIASMSTQGMILPLHRRVNHLKSKPVFFIKGGDQDLLPGISLFFFDFCVYDSCVIYFEIILFLLIKKMQFFVITGGKVEKFILLID